MANRFYTGRMLPSGLPLSPSDAAPGRKGNRRHMAHRWREIAQAAAIPLTVIEGKNAPYSNTLAMTEMMSLLNLANIADAADIVIPG